ncbi:GSK3-beta interaction protein [Trichinella zimbabwensis]|uniref:GSK3-beta interaction protein n=1 Tax=Trichinella zimbabwensis TaxID=268475 RepID=A0A0V1HBL1_9BILA|nr:GSK3-beta interaction protein [Trichinella zimbabwensis]
MSAVQSSKVTSDSSRPPTSNGETSLCSSVGRMQLFDLLLQAIHAGDRSWPLPDANTFADVLGVSPAYRQNEAKRWSSALQLYRQMSGQDLGELKEANVQATAKSPNANAAMQNAAAASKCADNNSSSSNNNGASLSAGCNNLFPLVKSSSSYASLLCSDALSKRSSPRSRGAFTPSCLTPPYRITAGLFGSRKMSGSISPGESSLNSLELEAIAAVHELHFAVKDIAVSDLLPRTSELIFLNITTLEEQAYCIELTLKGWRVASMRHDCMNGDFSNLELHTRYFETVYALMDTISVCYRKRFTDLLSLRLRQLQNMRDDVDHETFVEKCNEEKMAEFGKNSNERKVAMNSAKNIPKCGSNGNCGSSSHDTISVFSDNNSAIVINVERASGEFVGLEEATTTRTRRTAKVII